MWYYYSDRWVVLVEGATVVRSRVNRGRRRRAELREEAEERDELRATRTPEQQLETLDSKLGIGVGALRERARLVDQILERERKKSERGKSRVKSGKRDAKDGGDGGRRQRSKAKERREDARGRSRSGGRLQRDD